MNRGHEYEGESGGYIGGFGQRKGDKNIIIPICVIQKFFKLKKATKMSTFWDASLKASLFYKSVLFSTGNSH